MCPGHRLVSGPGYSEFFFKYVDQSSEDKISKMQPISHLLILGFINPNILKCWLLDISIKLLSYPKDSLGYLLYREYFIHSYAVFYNLGLGSINL